MADGVTDENEVTHAGGVLCEPHRKLDQVVTPRPKHSLPDVAVTECGTQLASHRFLLRGVDVALLNLALDDLLDCVVLASHHQLTAVVGEGGDEEDTNDSTLQHHTILDVRVFIIQRFHTTWCDS